MTIKKIITANIKLSYVSSKLQWGESLQIEVLHQILQRMSQWGESLQIEVIHQILKRMVQFVEYLQIKVIGSTPNATKNGCILTFPFSVVE